MGVDNIARRYTAVACMKRMLGLSFPLLALMGDSCNFASNCSRPWGHMYYGSGEYTYTTYLYHREGEGVCVDWVM